jgi:hypothetical protein
LNYPSQPAREKFKLSLGKILSLKLTTSFKQLQQLTMSNWTSFEVEAAAAAAAAPLDGGMQFPTTTSTTTMNDNNNGRNNLDQR